MKKTETKAEAEARMDAKLDELDEKETLRRAEATNLFEKAEFLNGATLPKKVLIPKLGGYVSFKKLTWQESMEINKVQNLQERSIKTLSTMIGKANPHLRIEELLRTVSLDDIAAISEAIFKAEAPPLAQTKQTQ